MAERVYCFVNVLLLLLLLLHDAIAKSKHITS